MSACDPARLVRDAMQWTVGGVVRRGAIGLAIGKAALACARGIGPVDRGLAVTHADDGEALPVGWKRMVAAHPEPDARSVAAGEAALELMLSTAQSDVVVAAISGGASSLVEVPRAGLTIERFRDEIRAVMASGAPIRVINGERAARSQIKGGKLGAMSAARVVTLALSDVVGDDVEVIGSGPTVTRPLKAQHVARVIAPIAGFARALAVALGEAREVVDSRPIVEGVPWAADRLADDSKRLRICYGEPVLALPARPGEGGRAQQLALVLAQRMRGSTRSALIAGSDGQDGPAPRGRPAPAGAFVDGTTWERILAAGIDGERAIAECNAGPALAAVGALVVTGPTGINHADVMVVG